MKPVWFIAIALVGSPAFGYGTKDFLGVRQATGIAVDPSGTSIAIAIERNDIGRDVRVSEIFLAKNQGKDLKLITEGSEPSWCGRKRLVFLRPSTSTTSLWAMKLGQEAVQLSAQGLDVSKFSCDPRSDRVAFVAAAAAPTTGNAPPPARLYISPGTGPGAHVIEGLDEVTAANWSPREDLLAVAAGDDLELVTPAGGRSPFLKRDGLDGLPVWSPDGSRMAFVTQDGDEANPVALAVADRGTGAVTPVGRDFRYWLRYQSPKWFGWRDSSTLLFSSLQEMRSHVRRIDLAEPAVAVDVTPHSDVLFACSGKSSTRDFFCLSSTPLQPPELVKLDQPDRPLTSLNPGLATAGLLAPEEVSWPSSDGLQIRGLLLKPRQDARRLPLIVLVMASHGTFDRSFSGRVSSDGNWMPPVNAQLLASAGFAVLMPNPRGSWGFGSDFEKKVRGDFAEGPFSDMESGAKAMVERGIADPRRIGIAAFGIFDAFRTVYGLTRSSSFSAAIIGFPIIDLGAWYGGTGGSLNSYFGGSPFAEPDRFAALDPVRHADKLKTPTLIFMRDQPTLFALQSRMLETALKDNKVEVEKRVYPEDFVHWPKPSEVTTTADAIGAWFGKYLVGGGAATAEPATIR